MPEDSGPAGGGHGFQGPKLTIWMVNDVDAFFEGFGDLIGSAFEINGVGVADCTGCAQ